MRSVDSRHVPPACNGVARHEGRNGCPYTGNVEAKWTFPRGQSNWRMTYDLAKQETFVKQHGPQLFRSPYWLHAAPARFEGPL